MLRLTRNRLAWVLAVLTVIMLVGVLLAGSASTPDVDDTTKTIAKGLESRESLLRTVESTLVTASFLGPGHPHRASKPDTAMTTYVAANLEREQWIAERRWYHVGPDDVLQSDRHAFDIWSEGLYAYKGGVDRDWEAATELSTDILEHVFLRGMFFMKMPCLPPALLLKGAPVVVTRETVDGVDCFRIDSPSAPSANKTEMHAIHWIDAGKGFAVRKWAWLRIKNGHVVWDRIGNAYDFREFEGLWLPMRTVIVTARLNEADERVWVQKDTSVCTSIEINTPVSIPSIPTDGSTIEYDEPELADESEQEAKRQELAHKMLRTGPGSPETIPEPLPKLYLDAEL